MKIDWIGSIHKLKGRNGFQPEAIVIHVMEGTLTGTDSWFNDPKSKVSAHYGIGKDGQVHQYVGESDTAYHAGRKSNPSWKLIKPNFNPNFYTIGIEHEGKKDTIWQPAMCEASARLIAEISNRWSIMLDRDHIIGHREIYAVKTCPGKADINAIVELAKQFATDLNAHNLIEQQRTVRTRVDVNLRQGSPTILAKIVRKIPANTEVLTQGWTSSGFSVNANPHWYKDTDGNFFWAGATDAPIPGI